MLNTNKGNLISTVHNQRKILKKLITISISIIQLLNLKNIVSNFTISLKVYIRELTCRNRNFFEAVGQFVVNLFSAGSLLSLRCVRRESENKLFQVLHFIFCLLLLLVSLALHNLSHLIPEVIVTRELSNLSKVNITDISTNSIQKVSVMRNYNYCVFKVQQKVFKPGNRFNIQTVCRLIKKQSIRVTINCLSQQNTNLLTFIKLTHHLVVEIFFKTKT